jgi:GNAT superfamily N-acetyltransferase
VTGTEEATGALAVRPLGRDDEAGWRRLWRGYLDFYGTELSEDVYRTSFARLTDPAEADYRGLVAERGGDLVGLAHCIFHRHGWRIEKVCYLQDLYVAESARGSGVGRILIEAVYAMTDAAGSPQVYWLTETGNARARRLYDRVGRATAFMKYVR